mmetsp:Transcript_22417/g.46507  ORF Transcript_22417/g.46507 Transcript_22417/m.46507 type:complete len:184 (-) Transcript_22417:1804-2355(-)
MKFKTHPCPPLAFVAAREQCSRAAISNNSCHPPSSRRAPLLLPPGTSSPERLGARHSACIVRYCERTFSRNMLAYCYTVHVDTISLVFGSVCSYLIHSYMVLNLYAKHSCKAFHWCDEKGIPWNQRLKAEARKEFQASKEETDPLIIARMLVTGRDCVQQIQQKFNEADRKAWERIEKDSSRR